jgi:hypothetical protein
MAAHLDRSDYELTPLGRHSVQRLGRICWLRFAPQQYTL